MLDRSLSQAGRARCLWCIPMETGAFIFGIFSSVVSGFGILALCVCMSSMNARIRDYNEEFSGSPSDSSMLQRRAIDLLMCYVSVVLVYICVIIMFIFSVFLCYGVHKRRSGFVKAYLIYGIVMTLLMMMGATLYSWLERDLMGGSLMLIVCGIYSLLLLMVHRTYEMFRAEANEQSQLLVTKPCMKA